MFHTYHNIYNRCIQLSASAGRHRRLSSSHVSDKVPSKDRALNDLILHEEEARKIRSQQAKRRLEKTARREERIHTLEERRGSSTSGSGSRNSLSEAEMAELEGLLRAREEFEEQYDPSLFTQEHLDYKSMHNDALIALTRYCERERATLCSEVKGESEPPPNVFFLDGPDGGTATALIDRGDFHARQCFVANRHQSTCDALRMKVPEMNVVHATAAEALTVGAPLSIDNSDATKERAEEETNAHLRQDGGAFANIDFTSYYFDGCGGFPPHITNMLSAALLRDNCDCNKPIAIGYSVLGGNKDVVTKELVISRALCRIARQRGMRMVHALDDPERYGISLDVQKIGGSGGGGDFYYLVFDGAQIGDDENNVSYAQLKMSLPYA
eukprot:CAMPEP_0183713674 /NCGR_PEP_ID=MMETSP0737-20130205/8448_1 /TAXON_ID=385413 /ORGANISM="Thalassiosira miniscula, Strain CCMP1093" /LENGTH=383 /DNA_ID=CAMNT_0025942493 /DNA_START=382 /DNA_END=1533 /DNA_ORIENTATION=+